MTQVLSEDPSGLLQKAAAEKKTMGELLEQSLKLVLLKLRGVPGYRQVPGTRVTLADRELDDKNFTGSAMRLLPREWRKRFNDVEAAARAHLRVSPPVGDTSPIEVPGCNWIPAQRFDDIKAAVEAVRSGLLAEAVADLKAAYPQLLENLRQAINDQPTWDRLLPTLPPAASLSDVVRLDFYEIPVTFLSQAGSKVADALAESIVDGLARSIEKAAEGLLDRGRNSVYRDGSFTALREAFEQLRGFDFLTSPAVLARLQAAEQEMADLGEDAHRTLNADRKTAEQSIIRKLSQAVSALSAEVRKDAGGRFRRAIQL